MKNNIHQMARIMHRHLFQCQRYLNAVSISVVPINKQYIYSSFIFGAFYTSSVLYASDHTLCTMYSL